MRQVFNLSVGIGGRGSPIWLWTWCYQLHPEGVCDNMAVWSDGNTGDPGSQQQRLAETQCPLSKGGLMQSQEITRRVGEGCDE